jgi:hypothetical protein
MWCLDLRVGSNFESIAELWLCNNFFGIANILTSAVSCGCVIIFLNS